MDDMSYSLLSAAVPVEVRASKHFSDALDLHAAA